MNIFILSKKPRRCARYHADKHVLKLLIEATQMLCAAHIILDSVTQIGDTPLYKLTHKNHPCTVWTRDSVENYNWLYKLFYYLCREYTYRYEKIHLCWTKFGTVLKRAPENIPKIPMTPFALAMPDSCKCKNPVKSYRNYYRTHKQHICTWTRRATPRWLERS